jgi:hypothetical protein
MLVVAAGLLLAVPSRAEPGARSEGWLLSIRSDSPCPDAAAVDRKTRDLLGVGVETALPESVELTHEGSGLSLKLRSDDQRLLGERVLPLEEDCDALARAVAVVLASWLTDAHPEFLAPRAPAADVPATAPEPQPAVAPPVRFVSGVHARGRLRTGPLLRLRPAAAVGALVDAHGVVPAGLLAVNAAPSGSGLGFGLRLALSMKRKQALGAGRLELLRFPLGAGGVLRLEHGNFAAEAHAGVALAWLHLEGRGFGTDHRVDDVAFGLFGALRGALVVGVVEPFLEVSGFGWPGAGSAFVDPPDPGVALPRGEIGLMAGAALHW